MPELLRPHGAALPPAAPATAARPGTAPSLRRGRCALLLAALAIAWLGALALAGCSGGSDPASQAGLPGPDAVLLPEEVRKTRDYMNDWYYWYSEVPQGLSLLGVDTAEETLEKLRYKAKDKFSFVEKASTATAYYDDNNTVAFGIGYKVRTDSSTVVVTQVPPGSPAATADVRRGDLIVSIDGVSAADMIAANTVASSFGDATAGVQRTFVFDRGGVQSSKTLTKASYHFSTVPWSATFTAQGRTFGYLYFTGFTKAATAEVGAAMAALATAGATDLILDVRNNGGGLLYVSRDLGSYLTDATVGGQLFWSTVFNDRHQSSNSSFLLDGATHYGFQNVVMLTSANSCSATEALLSGTRAYRSVITVGATTCGKPYGFTPADVGNDKLLYAISFVGANRNGPVDFVDGIAPDCAATDDDQTPFGDPSEVLTAAAITRVATGACPAAATDAPAVKSATGRTADERRYRSIQDIDGAH